MEKEKIETYKKWFAGVLVAIIVIVIIGLSMDNTNTTTSTNISNEVNTVSNKANNTNADIEKTKVVIIDFSQMQKADIEAWCTTNKIRCDFTEVYSETITKGLFVSQSIKANDTIYQGDKITITYSLGKEPTIGERNALAKARSYLSYSSFSYKGLTEQLKYEGFSDTEAVYGVDNCGADWNEQAAKKAKSYMEYSSFSRSRLISQLEYEGFTKTQSEYGASAVGY